MWHRGKQLAFTTPHKKPQKRSKKLFHWLKKTGQFGQLHLTDIVPKSDRNSCKPSWSQHGDVRTCSKVITITACQVGKITGEKGFLACSSGKRSHEHFSWRACKKSLTGTAKREPNTLLQTILNLTCIYMNSVTEKGKGG